MAWLRAMPLDSSLRISSYMFQEAARHQLLLPPTRASDGMMCDGCKRRDIHHAHLLTCPRSRPMEHSYHTTHQAGLMGIIGMLETARLKSTTKCARVLRPPPGVDRLVPDLYIPFLPGLSATAIDISYVHPVSGVGKFKDPAYEMEVRVGEKLDKYTTACDSQSIAFVPYVVSTYGTHHYAALAFVDVLARSVVQLGFGPPRVAEGSAVAVTRSRMLQVMSIATMSTVADRLARGVALGVSIGYRAPAGSSLYSGPVGEVNTPDASDSVHSGA